MEILYENSSQAKGRVERANRTLQDRLPKEPRTAEICDIPARNTFLPGSIYNFNVRFAVILPKAGDLRRKLNLRGSRLADILCHREQRHVGQQLTLAFDRTQIILERNEVSEGWRDSMSSI